MEAIAYQTESWLYEYGDQLLRAIPFKELEYNEYVIHENGSPKYFVTFEWEDSPVVKQLTNLIMNQQYATEMAIQLLGQELGLVWSTRTNIPGEEVEGSQQCSIVTLYLLRDLNEVTTVL